MKIDGQTVHQCQMLEGDASGPKGHCQALAAMTTWFAGTQYRVCSIHAKMLQAMEKGRLLASEGHSSPPS